jgi:hypothetical protein
MYHLPFGSNVPRGGAPAPQRIERALDSLTIKCPTCFGIGMVRTLQPMMPSGRFRAVCPVCRGGGRILR